MPIIQEFADRGLPLEIGEINDAVAFDFITGFIFGASNSTNLLEDAHFRKTFLTHHYTERSQGLWKQELPRIHSLMKQLGLNVTTESAKWMQDWFLHAFERYRSEHRRNTDETGAVLLKHLSPISMEMCRQSGVQDPHLTVISEIHDHGVAGSETSGQMVTNAMQALSQRPHLQHRLRNELSLHFCTESQPMKPVQLGRLPLLHAIVVETLRHRDRGPFPRQAQQPASIVGCQNLPAGTRISLYSHVVHHDKAVFPLPDEWNPDRWLYGRAQGSPERSGKAGRSFLAFGAGDRSCVGRDLAMYNMKILLATVYYKYQTSLANETAGGRKKMSLMFELA